MRSRFLTLFIAFALAPIYAAEPPDFMLGVDANYSLDMETKGCRWKWDGAEQDLFVGMKEHGIRWVRIRLWTGEERTNGRQYAKQVVQRATGAGLTPYLVIFLSDNWADLTKQPAPEKWTGLSLDDKAARISNYCREVVSDFHSNGLTSHLCEIGNEIDNGICGVYPGKHSKKDPESLRQSIWPDAAKLILAAEAGVREIDPDAKFLLHIAHWWDSEFCVAFFQFMRSQGVQIDYAGLSYFPSSNIGNSLTFDQFGEVIDQLHGAMNIPIVIAETGYPSTTDFSGQFAAWKNEVPGYPLTAQGQRKWLTDLLKFCRQKPSIAGAFYWSPEWYGPSPGSTDGIWKAFALFDRDGNAQPAWEAFAVTRQERE